MLLKVTIFLTFYLSTFVSAFSAEYKQEIFINYEDDNLKLSDLLVFPLSSKPQWHDSNRVTIHPSISNFIDDQNSDETLRIYITFEGVSGSDEVSAFLKKVRQMGCKPNCRYEITEKTSQYTKFVRLNQNNSSKQSIQTFYLYDLKDSSPILLEDPGNWSKSLRVKRKTQDSILLDYLIPKHLACTSEVSNKLCSEKITNFDEKVIKYINEHHMNLSQ